MFQSFETQSDPSKGPDRLSALRGQMSDRGLSGYLVPRADVHQGEYVADCDARLAWLTGFTGSAGFCAVLADRAGVFVDGRYRVQVKSQVAACYTPVDWPEVSLGEWLLQHAPAGAVIGFDPWLHTVDEISKLRETLGDHAEMRALAGNLVDAIWRDRPSHPATDVFDYPLEFAGEDALSKLARCATDLAAAGHDAAIITQPDSINWLLNIRGNDVPRVPLAHSLAILKSDGSLDLFIAPTRVGNATLPNAVRVSDPSEFAGALSALTGKVRIDPASCPQAVKDSLTQATPVTGRDPALLPKARKNDTEIAGTVAAHERDAVAMAEFLAWLAAQEPETLDEIAVVTALEGFRSNSNALKDISFDTICGAGEHGAIMHYRVTHETNRRVKQGELLLVDSGAQYLDGTTDITRTMAMGQVGDEERAAYTRVLQGMVNISRLRFPRGIAGRDIDAIARMNLWNAGQDFAHGTGHGVGVYLSVHEGPQRISRVSTLPLEVGMILSNEPGFYLEGRFGIRIENLIVVEPAPAIAGGTIDGMLQFRTLTWVPFDRNLIVPDMLSREERDWINTYHAQCHSLLSSRLSADAAKWLDHACAPI